MSGKDDITTELYESVMKGLGISIENQRKDLEYHRKTDRQTINQGKHSLHKKYPIKESSRRTSRTLYEEKMTKCLDDMLKNWDDREKREKLERRYQDILVLKELSKGVREPGNVDDGPVDQGSQFEF